MTGAAPRAEPKWPFVAAAALFFVSLAIGTAVDDAPARPPTRRAGYLVLEADFHAHTRFSDGFLSPFDLVLQARRRGLDVLGITEHNILFPAQLGRWFSPKIGGPTVLAGEEVTTNRFHLIAVGLTSRIHAGDPLDVTLDAVHAQGGIAIAAHPVRKYWDRFDAVLDRLDGTEVMHPLAYGARTTDTSGAPLRGNAPNGWHWDDMRLFYAHALEKGRRLTAIGSSDYHFFSPLGVTRTLVFAERDDEAAVLDALRRGRTVVYDLDGHAYGDPELAQALAKEPYVPRAIDYAYRGNGVLDRASRVIGWFGLLGLALLARPRRREG